MKNLTVYYERGYQRFPNVYIDFMFEKQDDGALIITEKDSITGEERIVAAFNKWDYLLIEEE